MPIVVTLELVFRLGATSFVADADAVVFFRVVGFFGVSAMRIFSFLGLGRQTTAVPQLLYHEDTKPSGFFIKKKPPRWVPEMAT
jgi:hypothetical protein